MASGFYVTLDFNNKNASTPVSRYLALWAILRKWMAVCLFPAVACCVMHATAFAGDHYVRQSAAISRGRNWCPFKCTPKSWRVQKLLAAVQLAASLAEMPALTKATLEQGKCKAVTELMDLAPASLDTHSYKAHQNSLINGI
jgi:hypothetical protein